MFLRCFGAGILHVRPESAKDETNGKTTVTTLGSNNWTFGTQPYNGNNITMTSSKMTVVIPQGCSVTITAGYTRSAFTFRNDNYGDVNYAMYYSGQGYRLAKFRCSFSTTIYLMSLCL